MSAALTDACREIVFLDQSNTQACLRRIATSRSRRRWYAVASCVPSQTLQAVSEFGGRLLASVNRPLGGAHQQALRALVAAHGDEDAVAFPTGFETDAAAVMRRMCEQLQTRLPHARIHFAWCRAPLTACIVADNGDTELRVDHLCTSPAVLALRCGQRDVRTDGRDSARAVAIPLGGWPELPGSRWALDVSAFDSALDDDAIEARVLRCALEAIASLPRRCGAGVPEGGAAGPFRAHVLAEWRRARRPQEPMLPWPASLGRIAYALVALALVSPLLLLLPIERSVSCAATVVATERYDVVAPFAGTAHDVGAAAGTSLRRGQALFRLVGHAGEGDAEMTLQHYRAQIAQRLLDPAATDSASARDTLRNARAALQALAGTTVRAPAHGILADIAVRDGRAIVAGERLATVLPHAAKLSLDIRIPARHAHQVRRGSHVSVVLDDDGGTRLDATIESMSTVATAEAGDATIVTARARFDAPIGASLLPDSIASADVALGRSSVFALLTGRSSP